VSSQAQPSGGNGTTIHPPVQRDRVDSPRTIGSISAVPGENDFLVKATLRKPTKRTRSNGPDGVDYENKIVFIEVVRPERLVYEHGPGPKFHVTVTFEEQGGKTNLTMRSLFDSAAERDHVVEKFGAIEGGNQTVARLAEYLAKM
jgi:hypothetical protein